jgi:hypothetical protein
MTTGGGGSNGEGNGRSWRWGHRGSQRWRGRRNDDGNISVDRSIKSHSIDIPDMV